MVDTQFAPSPLLTQTPPASKIYNTYGLYLRTPLTWAMASGYKVLVKLLLGWKEVSPDEYDKWGKVLPLHATEQGHEGVMETLLR